MCSKEDSFDYQVLNLTNSFYSDYPDPPYKEIVRKNSRPKFKKSIRSKRANSGLDYSKIVIIKKSEYIGITDAIVDKDEFNETRDNIEYIKNDAQQYIDDYVNYLLIKSKKYDKREFERIYKYSTLQYFHNELGIISSKKDTN